jgi:hypothetical protein
VVALEERRGLLQLAHHHLFAAALGRWALGRRLGAQAHRGDTELGGEPGRGTLHDSERQRLLAVLFRQPLGD